MNYPNPIPNGLLNYQTCKYCSGTGCATCNDNGWYGVVEPGQGVYIKKVKYKKAKSNRKVDAYEISEMVRLFIEERMKQTEIGKMFDLSHGHVSTLINKWIKGHPGEFVF